MKRFTAKQKLFIHHYLATLNGVEAAKKAGYKGSYSTLGVTAHDNLKNPAIREVIDKHMKDKSMPEWGTAIRPAKTKSKKVYLIKESFRGLVKIGIATNLRSRLSALQTSCPQELDIIGYIDAKKPRVLERELHKRYAHLHHRGEWFSLSNDDIDTILNYHNGYTAVSSQLPLFTDHE